MHLSAGPARIALLLAAFAVRAATLARESFWRDEVDAVLFAAAPLPDLLHSFTVPQHNGPAYHLALRLWIELGGTSEYAVRLFSTFGDLVAMALAMVAGRRFGGRAVDLGVGTIWAVLPATIWYAREGKMYAWLAALAALCLYLVARSRALGASAPARLHGPAARETDTGARPLDAAPCRGRCSAWSRSALGPAIALGLAVVGVYVHFFAALLTLPIALVGVQPGHPSRSEGSAPGAPDAARRRWPDPVLLVGLLLAAGAASVIAFRERDLLLAPPPTGHPFVPLGELLPRLLYGLTLNTPPLAGVASLLLLAAPFIAGVLAVPGETPASARRRAAVLALFVTLPVAAFYVVSLRLPLFAERYFVILLPALLVLAARGFVALWSRWRVVAAVVAAPLALLLLSADARQIAMPRKPDYRALGAYLREAARPGDGLMVVMPYNERSVRFYAGEGLTAIAAPDPSRPVTTNPPIGRLWLVLAESEQYDPDGRIERWLAASRRLGVSHAWRGLELRRFDGA